MLKVQMENAGTWMFRWRSYLPLVLAPIFMISLIQFRYPFDEHVFDVLWECVCFAISLSGLALRVLTVGYVPRGTSGRNTRTLKADQLNTTGIYSTVRHPLYVANFLVFTGALLYVGMLGEPWIVPLAVVTYWIYYERIMMAEERFLAEKYGSAYEQWASKTPAILPRISQWVRPTLTFSFKRTLKREYHTLFAIAAVFTAIEVTGDYFIHDELAIDLVWGLLFGSALAFYLTVRCISKYTSWLEVQGR